MRCCADAVAVRDCCWCGVRSRRLVRAGAVLLLSVPPPSSIGDRAYRRRRRCPQCRPHGAVGHRRWCRRPHCRGTRHPLVAAESTPPPVDTDRTRSLSSTALSTESIHRNPGVVDTATDSTVETAGSPWSSTPPRATLNTRCGTPRLSSSTPLERLLSSGSTATLSVSTQSDRSVSTPPGVIVLLAGCCRQ